MSGCLTCRHYIPNPRWTNTPVCSANGCRYQPRKVERSAPANVPSPETTSDFGREYNLAPWAFDGETS